MNTQYPQRERGQALITVVIALLVLLLFAALAVDVGQMYTQRRHMQNAADAGALAGARELCLGHTETQAIAVANDYAGPRNGAPQVQSAVNGNIVVVTATVPVTSFFAQLIGITTTPVHATAKAACGQATSGCGIFPIAFDTQVYNNIPCNTYFYVWADDNSDIDDTLCQNCDCTAAFLGRAVIGPGDRGWLAFSPPAYPYTSPCSANCGASALACWIDNDWPGKVEINQCIPGKSGVVASDVNAVDDRINDTIRILLWDPDQPAGACTSSNTVGDCSGTGYQVKGFGCVTIIQVIKKLKLDNLPGAPNPSYKCPKNDKVILVYKPCSCPLSECGGTSGTPVPVDGVGAVSLID
ncbi:MAG: pilus assembly protein TadG-related protein [Chloroflexi bacterium]|nr:pilus assembly protein TadG-related protein [Chloroflexota bacterium]